VDPNITLDGVIRGCLECGVVAITPDGQVTHLDAAARRLLSIDAPLPASADVLPLPLQEIVKPALKQHGAVPAMEFHLRADGAEEQVRTLHVSPIPCGTHEHGLLLLVRGLTANHPFESKLRHFERLARLGVLSASLAHELRNALVALNTMTDLLLEERQDNELALTVRRELDRANALAARMLKYARPHAESRKPISTHVVLDRALQLANSRFKEAGATVTKSWLADPDVVSADEAHLEQMFLNLLINAADAIEQRGEVTLSTDVIHEQPLGQAVRIAVRDTGAGISPDALPNLFEPFFTTKRHGTGLGLYLAQRIIDEHSGMINVDSTPGHGTCVQVLLPVHRD